MCVCVCVCVCVYIHTHTHTHALLYMYTGMQAHVSEIQEQKRPTTEAEETYYRVKETYRTSKRGLLWLLQLQKRPNTGAKETCITGKKTRRIPGFVSKKLKKGGGNRGIET